MAVAGTATALAAIELELEPYDPTKTHRFQLTTESVRESLEHLSGLTLAQRRKVKGLEPDRAGTIVSGAGILLGIMDYFNLSRVLVSEKDILDGLIVKAISE